MRTSLSGCISTALRRARRFSRRGDYSEAQRCFRKALRFAGKSLAFASVRPYLWNELGMACKYSAKFDSAARYYRLAARYARHFEGEQRDFLLSTIYHNLGGVEHSRRRFVRAEAYARKGLALRLRCVPGDNLAVASDRAALAAILDGRHRRAEAERHYRFALRIYRREYGPSHPDIAVVLNNLGALYQELGRSKEAESSYRAALRMKRNELGGSHPDVAVTMNNLAILCRSQGRTELARSWFKKACEILAASLGSSHPTTQAVKRNLANTGH